MLRNEFPNFETVNALFSSCCFLHIKLVWYYFNAESLLFKRHISIVSFLVLCLLFVFSSNLTLLCSTTWFLLSIFKDQPLQFQSYWKINDIHGSSTDFLSIRGSVNGILHFVSRELRIQLMTSSTFFHFFVDEMISSCPRWHSSDTVHSSFPKWCSRTFHPKWSEEIFNVSLFCLKRWPMADCDSQIMFVPKWGKRLNIFWLITFRHDQTTRGPTESTSREI